MIRIKFIHNYNNIISLENLLRAWEEFVIGKRRRRDVQEFAFNLMTNIFQLQGELRTKTYQHSPYTPFNISDPKPRNIHKASVRDRLLHHAIYRHLYPFFDRTFIADSYSCRLNKGTHKAMRKFRDFGYRVSRNRTRTAWVLKCDIKKFFASIDQDILLNLLGSYIADEDILWLLSRIIRSFDTGKPGIGLPLGNLTSQLFVNIYMNVFDQFVKHKIKAQYYIRYADDFVFLSEDKSWLEETLFRIGDFLGERLHLSLHPDKISIRTLASGVDFLGWVHFSDHRILRTTTKRRMLKNIVMNKKSEVLGSYLGLLKHGNTQKLQRKIIASAEIEKF
ncbi:MAG: reverse transcriptase/maturase family protein [bacterium]|nr:reverse transcriptase/maturase family protein [bacterium]